MDDMYRKAVDAAAIFSETDLSGRITYVNEQFCDVSGYPREELLGANHRILNSGFHPPEFFVGMWRTISRGQVWKGEICNRGKDGTVYWVDSTMVPLVDESTGQVRKYLSIRFDVSEKRQLLHTLQWRVGHDVLTGLPNRAYLSDLLNQALESSRADGIPLAVCMLDLDGFKAVNDGYGHASGDLLLIEVAKRLKSIMRGEDVVARLAGDEFVLILRHADQAMYVAKQSGRNRYYVFDVLKGREIKATHEQVERVRQALAAGELCLHYQPKVNMRTGEVLGFEGLLRWHHPKKGLMEPCDFLPVVEQTDLIIDIGEWVIDQAIRQMHEWQRAGAHWSISVNIAARHFQRADFVARLKVLLGRYAEVAPEKLDLEIIESAAIENMQHVSQCLKACQALGVRFSLDDFGTGYSSLSYLKRLPTETIKIDKSFVRDILHDQDDLALTTAVVGLARAFGRNVIAEGLESEAQGCLLMELGCEVAQGYFIARPMPIREVANWVAGFEPPGAWLQAACA